VPRSGLGGPEVEARRSARECSAATSLGQKIGPQAGGWGASMDETDPGRSSLCSNLQALALRRLVVLAVRCIVGKQDTELTQNHSALTSEKPFGSLLIANPVSSPPPGMYVRGTKILFQNF